MSAIFVMGVVAPFLWAQDEPEKLSTMSVEDLLNVEVTSVSKTQQKLSRTASAIYVISREDIQRSGATNIPDLLRMVPGMDVAQINANTWAISARGFNGRFSNDLLVMVGGRTVYSPTFGGVFWDVLDFPLEDIERIEVIRGPGSSVWGANAVTGVVNIITKKAAETKGAMLVAGGGNVDQGLATLPYGGSIRKATDYRVYSKYLNQSELRNGTGFEGGDNWHVLRGGFRIDTDLSAKDSLTFQGDLYSGREGEEAKFASSITSPVASALVRVNLTGGFLQAAWSHSSTRTNSTLEVSYDHTQRSDVLMETRDTWDADFTQHIVWGGRQNVVWGLDYRYSSADSNGGVIFSVDPANLNTQLFSSFVEDEIAVLQDRFYLTAGTKLEQNYYTGFGIMPTFRAARLPTAHQTLWVAFSRPLRTPSERDVTSRIDFGAFVGPGGTPGAVRLFGSPNFSNERSRTYEFGYRNTLGKNLSLDVSTFYTQWEDQDTTEPESPLFEEVPAPPHLLLPFTYGNLMNGDSYGLEAFAKWKVTRRLELSPGDAFERIDMHLDPGSRDTTSVAGAEGAPRLTPRSFDLICLLHARLLGIRPLTSLAASPTPSCLHTLELTPA